MPSSTSNSNHRAPTGNVGRTWLLALGLVLLLMGGWEVYWRLQGFRPSVYANDASWSVVRSQVGPSSVVVIGTSRIQAALDPDVWNSVRDEVPLQLALLGTSPVPLLGNLAEESEFAGTVLVEILPLFAFDAAGASEARSHQALDRYRRMRVSPALWTEDWLRMRIPSAFVFRDPALTAERLAREWSNGRDPTPLDGSMRVDRYFPLDFDRLDPDRPWSAEEGYIGLNYPIAVNRGRPASPDELTEMLESMDSSVRQIQARGGKVVYLHLPACGGRLAIEERRYPRDSYWDRLATSTSGVAFHAGDYPLLSEFPCYDGSHMDMADAPAFTRALAELVTEALGGDG